MTATALGRHGLDPGGARSGWARTRTTRRRRPCATVAVDGFWIDTHAVTNRAVRGVRARRPATSRSPSARSTRPLPGRARREPRPRLDGLPAHARPGRPAPDGPVVGVDAGCVLAAPGGPGLDARGARGPPGRPRRVRGRRGLRRRGRARALPTEARVGARRARRARRRDVHLGRRARAAGRAARQLLARRLPVARRARLRHDRAGRLVPAQRLRPLRHGRQRLGVDDGPGSTPRSRPRASRRSRIPRRVVKGGSFLCADSYCRATGPPPGGRR